MQPEQSTADTTIQLGIISNSSSERRQRQHGGEEGQCGRAPSVRGRPGDAARHGKGKAPGAGKHRQPEHNKTPPAVPCKGEPRTENLNTTNPSRRCNKERRTSGWASAAAPARPHGGTRSPAPPRRPSPWLTSRKAWVKDGSSESFSAISSGRYFSSMAAAAARSGSGAGAPGAPAGKERVRVPGSGKSSEAALPPGRLPPGAAGTHPEGSAASPRPGGGEKGRGLGGRPPSADKGRGQIALRKRTRR